ncbi:MAG: hypothetical protein IAA31_06435 [Candidatus Anaerobiospirillum merdipullorum]|uniref:Uncharacterized protein n=1 Tax=Candidatus Anaerobiospirillum merdipullorum TaxID=2838450 RepID=A0A9E2KNA6_9GAMM|nr:hypothetical protein [Candidatus Anaerobiospirillum merdipullorum]
MTDNATTAQASSQAAPQAAEQFIDRAQELAAKVHGLVTLTQSDAKPADSAILLRIVKPLWVTAENLLPELNHLQDFLTQEEQEQSAVTLRHVIEDLEEDLVILASVVSKLEKEQALSKSVVSTARKAQ